jgi:hypothetical protein
MWQPEKGGYRSDRSRDLGQQGQSSTRTHGIREMVNAQRPLTEVLKEKGKSVEDILPFKPRDARDARQKDIDFIKSLPATLKDLSHKSKAEERLQRLPEIANHIREIKARADKLELIDEELINEFKKLQEHISSSDYNAKRYTMQSFRSQIQSILET